MAREMKDSGVEWIGEIPVDWKMVQLKRFVKINNGREVKREVSEDYQDAVAVYGSGGIFKYTDEMQYSGKAVMFGRKGTLGKPLYVDDTFWTVDTMYFLTYESGLDECFSYYQLMVFDWEPYITHTAIPSIVASQIVACHFPIPNTCEQIRIASYLDRQCFELDNVLEKTRESIEEYKKLKQAVITQAVTKGIRSNREMKDSGNKWLGEIPADIEISRVGLHYEIILGKMLCTNQIDATYTYEPYFCAADIHFEGIAEGERKRMWFSPLEKQQYIVKKDDLLVVEGGAGAGGCIVVPMQEVPTYIQNSIMIVRPGKSADVRYLKYLIECLVKQGYIGVVCNKATIPHFTKDKLANVPFPVFSLQEQKEIAQYLEKKCFAIDDIIAKKEQYLSEIENYKKSLIYEYVTGKKEA